MGGYRALPHVCNAAQTGTDRRVTLQSGKVQCVYVALDSEAFLLVRDDGSPAVIETVSGNEKPPMAKHVV